ncbi:hypothetical protein AAFC00_005085 [Neodothiora populina]
MLFERRGRENAGRSALPSFDLPIQNRGPKHPDPPAHQSSSATPDISSVKPDSPSSPELVQELDIISESVFYTPRDAVVSNETWAQLEADRASQAYQEAQRARHIETHEFVAERVAFHELAQEAHLNTLEQQSQLSHSEDQANEIKRLLEAARLAKAQANRDRQLAEAQIEQAMKAAEEQRRKEAVAQKKLREMGVCCAGFRRIKQSGGYRCAGGSHWVSDLQLDV